MLIDDVPQDFSAPPEPSFAREHLSHACHGVFARAVIEKKSFYEGTLILLEPSRGVLRQSFGYQPRFAPPPRLWQGGRLTHYWRAQLPALIEQLVACWLPFERHHEEFLARYRRAAAELHEAHRAFVDENRRFCVVRNELRSQLEKRVLTMRAFTHTMHQLKTRRGRCRPPEPSGLLWGTMLAEARRIVGHDVDARALTAFLDTHARDAGCGWHLSRPSSSIAPRQPS